jgi:arylsulfatase A-like enzyme
MNRPTILAAFSLALTLSAVAAYSQPSKATSKPAAQRAGVDRTVLPIAEPVHPQITTLDAREAKAPPRFQVEAPDGAPNVLVILIDDMGFGMPSAFGGPIQMPTADRLATEGLRYNRFHTTALCSPTRTALLSGRNHHMNNMGAITETATAFPGYTGQRPSNVAPLAEMLRLNGYSTSFFGKNHETAAWEVSPSGPTDRWPTRSGFDKFYGFIGGETNQWAPFLYDGLSPVETPDDPNYHFLTDMTDKAVSWMLFQKALTPDKPFFMYFAPGATHAPHHVSKEWIAKYKGKFDQGWDKLREETLARQIKLGVVPAGTKLAPKPADIKDWETLTADEKRLFARQMEVYAAYGAFADAEVGRVLDAVDKTGEAANTLVFYILGDNGTSAEGSMNGLFNEYTYFNGVPETVADQISHIDNWGDPSTYPHMAAGWAVAGDTPFTWTKQVASNFGGTRNGVIVRWPQRIKDKGGLRSQFTHVIDVAPTVLEAAGLPEPKSVNGTVQAPIEGKSMVYSFDDAKAPERHTTQYFEMFGNRAIYSDGMFAATIHKYPWSAKAVATLQQDTWQLYDTRSDFSLANDLSAKDPATLKKLQELFLTEAKKYRVLPVDDRVIERANAKVAGRPDLMGDRTSLTLYDGMKGMSENVFINIKNRSHSISADVEIPAAGANGAVLVQGGRFGGWALYFKDGKPSYTYNYLGMQHFTVSAPQAPPAGKATVRFDFVYAGGGVGKGGDATLTVNGTKVAEAKIPMTQGLIFSADETADVGMDDATPVVESVGHGKASRFTGKIGKVTVELK